MNGRFITRKQIEKAIGDLEIDDVDSALTTLKDGFGIGPEHACVDYTVIDELLKSFEGRKEKLIAQLIRILKGG